MDPIIFAIGLATGAAAALWHFREYISFPLCPRPQTCPHHQQAWRDRIGRDNADERARVHRDDTIGR